MWMHGEGERLCALRPCTVVKGATRTLTHNIPHATGSSQQGQRAAPTHLEAHRLDRLVVQVQAEGDACMEGLCWLPAGVHVLWDAGTMLVQCDSVARCFGQQGVFSKGTLRQGGGWRAPSFMKRKYTGTWLRGGLTGAWPLLAAPPDAALTTHKPESPHQVVGYSPRCPVRAWPPPHGQ